MLIRLFKRNAAIIPLLILLAALLLWVDGFFFYERLSPAPRASGPLYGLISGFLAIHPLFNKSFAFLLLVLQSFFLNGIVQSNNLLGRPSWLPGFVYLVLMSSHPEMLQFHPALVANLFLMIALARILMAFTEGVARVEVFNVGFLVAVAGLFCYPALSLFFWLILTMMVFYLVNVRGLAAALLGVISPFFFLFTFDYLTDQLMPRFARLGDAFEPLLIFQYSFPAYSVVLGITLAAISLLAFLKLTLSYVNDKPIRFRKRFRVLWYFFLVSLFSFLAVDEDFEKHLALLMIPLSVVFSLFLLEIKKRWLAELVFYGFLLIIIAGKVIYWGS